MAQAPDVTLAGRAVRANQHVCAFFNSKEEECRVLLPSMREGLEHGERIFNVVDPRLGEAHRARLREAVASAAGRPGL